VFEFIYIRQNLGACTINHTQNALLDLIGGAQGGA